MCIYPYERTPLKKNGQTDIVIAGFLNNLSSPKYPGTHQVIFKSKDPKTKNLVK